MGKKKGRKRKFDFKDYGMGYDESDPFVDNSEACDEVSPVSPIIYMSFLGIPVEVE